ncbi:zinc ABC transporter substrate-binding protein [Nitrincola tapanii]|uniref:zinc ABC transporter substrate-binding protein n=1 Tax=Nitrincola tapanii TaxID=1708751 RepID=UPI003899508D
MWLDPVNALEIARVMAQSLTEIYPQHQARVQENLQAFETQIQALDQKIAEQLAPVQTKGFFVFHDAYGHFVSHYGLNQLGYFTLDPARQPGARHLAAIRKQLEDAQAVCVFSEPQFTPAVVESVSRGTTVRKGELDPLARDIPTQPGAYALFLQDLSQRFLDCLQDEI